jgi:hypothetical protein
MKKAEKLLVLVLAAVLMGIISPKIMAQSGEEGEEITLFTKNTRSPTVGGYLNEVVTNLHNKILFGDGLSAFVDFYVCNLEQINFLFGANMANSENISVPLIFGFKGGFPRATFDTSEKPLMPEESPLDLIAGGGLVIHGKYGLLAGYAFYDFGGISSEGKADHRLQWGVYPLLATNEFPILRYFLTALGGYFTLDRNDFKPIY